MGYTVKPLSQQALEFEVLFGKNTTPYVRFLARYNGLPENVRAGLQHGVLEAKQQTIYDTVYNETNTPNIVFFNPQKQRLITPGITNFSDNKFGNDDVFFVDNIRLNYGHVKKDHDSSATNITSATEAIVANVVKTDYWKEALPLTVANGSLTVSLDSKDVITNLLCQEFLGLQNKQRPKVQVQSLFFGGNKPFTFTINLVGGNLQIHEALRLELEGILITKK